MILTSLIYEPEIDEEFGDRHYFTLRLSHGYDYPTLKIVKVQSLQSDFATLGDALNHALGVAERALEQESPTL